MFRETPGSRICLISISLRKRLRLKAIMVVGVIGLSFFPRTESVICLGQERTPKDSDVEALKQLGAKIVHESDDPKKPIIGISLQGAKVTDSSLAHLKDMGTIQTLELEKTNVT